MNETSCQRWKKLHTAHFIVFEDDPRSRYHVFRSHGAVICVISFFDSTYNFNTIREKRYGLSISTIEIIFYFSSLYLNILSKPTCGLILKLCSVLMPNQIGFTPVYKNVYFTTWTSKSHTLKQSPSPVLIFLYFDYCPADCIGMESYTHNV